ncbi:rhomboid family intramembrane serine protease [Geobacter sp.]|uniref:rhomboid family intramembrane serine protease n=1 Tax=Geobacter sp. TaxID=46610 RepID=UPI002618B47E|nr:rhomboid family intramembrane serine protease [Geobacter sp.]
MIPIKDYNPTRRFPVMSVTIIALNIVVFFYDRLTGHYEPMLIETARGVVRTEVFVGGLSAHFSLVPAALASLPLLAWPTIFTSMFLHGNWLHIGSNMLYLWIFGNNVEDTLGRFRFVLFYFACGATAAIAQVMSAPHSSIPMVGASGAVAGVMGAYLLLFPRARILTLVPILFFFTFIEVPAFLIIGWWVLIQFLNASWLGGGELQRGGVAYFAHIGGFAAGMSLILLWGVKRGGRYRRR